LNTFDFKLANERFFWIVSESGLSYENFGRSVGITKGQVSNIISGAREVSETLAIAIENEYKVNRRWILSGEGKPELSERDRNLNEIARITAQGRKLDQVPEIKHLLDAITKLKKEDYNSLVLIINKFVKK